ncbi:MAG: hypothetical protein WAM79_19205 [Candidatus Sulfotelmatobacter sp.]
MRLLAILTLLSAFALPVVAQRVAYGVPPYSGRFISRLQVGSHFHHDRGFSGDFYSPFGYGFFPPDLYADDVATSQPSQPVVVMQVLPAPAPVAEAPVPSAQPLMIELQGDRYVQVSGSEGSSSQTIDQTPPRASVRTEPVRAQRPQQNSAVLLVFRDGHSEEISSYTIENGILYSSADFYTAGSWNREIELSSLNLPETLSSNHSRGVPFMLPTAPNEVVVGP